MAVLKTYSISTDITGGSLNVSKLHAELIAAGDIVGFDGIIVNGNAFDVLGTSFTVANVDATVLAHVSGTLPSGWEVPTLNLGDFVTNGVSVFTAVGAGILYTFDPNQTDEIVANISLENNGIAYDGSEILFEVGWQMFSAAPAGKNIQGELDYAFVSDGDDNYTKVDGTLPMFVDTDTITERQNQTNYFAKFSGPAGAKILQLTLRRIGLTDTYNGDVDFYSAALKNA